MTRPPFVLRDTSQSKCHFTHTHTSRCFSHPFKWPAIQWSICLSVALQCCISCRPAVLALCQNARPSACQLLAFSICFLFLQSFVSVRVFLVHLTHHLGSRNLIKIPKRVKRMNSIRLQSNYTANNNSSSSVMSWSGGGVEQLATQRATYTRAHSRARQ